MSNKLIDLGNGFWNVRGSFKIGGVIDVGTQCSLVKLDSGKFIFLDSYTLEGAVRNEIMALTNDGQDVEAILNLHPFHTVHCAQMAKDFPQAINYGSVRHTEQVPEVDWAKEFVESDEVTSQYPELEFSLPDGIYYISPNENVHASSLLAYHPASKTLHVDDTFSTVPETLKNIKLLDPILPELMLHPTVKSALKDEPDAGKMFCDWAQGIASRWSDTLNLCAAHSSIVQFKAGEFKTALTKAVEKARPKLEGASN